MFVGRTFDSAYATGQYASVLIHIEDLGVHSKNSDIKGPAKHVSVEMKNIHFVAYCHFLADLFSILGCLSLQMQRDNIILPTAVSHLKETITQVECLRNHPEPDGYLTKFMIKSTQTFQGIPLRGSLQEQTKRGKSISESFQSEIETAENLTTQGLRKRFSILLNAKKQPSDVISYGRKEVESDMLVILMLTAGQHVLVN